MKIPLAWLLLQKWLWITILGCISVVLLPFLIVYGILILPAEAKVAAIFTVIGAWSIAGAYKDWAISKRREEAGISR